MLVAVLVAMFVIMVIAVLVAMFVIVFIAVLVVVVITVVVTVVVIVIITVATVSACRFLVEWDSIDTIAFIDRDTEVAPVSGL